VSALTTALQGGHSGRRWLLLVVGIAVALLLPWFVYPAVALDIVIFALFGMAVDLLLGYTGLLSFGHAAFFGGAAYVAGLASLQAHLPYPLAVLVGALFAALLAVPIGYLSIKRTGIYFAMVTLAFAQMVYAVANQWRSVTGGENGLQGVPRTVGSLEIIDPFYFYYAAVPLLLLAMLVAWRVVNSPFGKVLAAIRHNPDRARALGYPVHRYKLIVFVISAALAGVAGSLYSLNHSLASLNGVDWTMSGQVVVIVVLGGVGTLWGSALGAALIVLVEHQLSLSGFEATDVVVGVIFVVVVLLFRRGIWGTVADRLRGRSGRRSRAGSVADEAAEPDALGSSPEPAERAGA